MPKHERHGSCLVIAQRGTPLTIAWNQGTKSIKGFGTRILGTETAVMAPEFGAEVTGDSEGVVRKRAVA
jgi:hypothetical protein